MDKKKFLKIFEMAIESEEITEITLKIWTLMGPEYTTFGREKFNEMYEYYKNNSDIFKMILKFIEKECYEIYKFL